MRAKTSGAKPMCWSACSAARSWSRSRALSLATGLETKQVNKTDLSHAPRSRDGPQSGLRTGVCGLGRGVT
jgi:hypothetical protein